MQRKCKFQNLTHNDTSRFRISNQLTRIKGCVVGGAEITFFSIFIDCSAERCR